MPEGVESVYEIVVNGLSETAVTDAMRVGMKAASEQGAQLISAANYGGDLGKYKFHLHEIIKE